MDELLIKYVLGEATAEECRRVEAWAAESGDNRRRLEEFRRVRALGRRGAAPVRRDPGEALGRLRERIAETRAGSGFKLEERVHEGTRWMKPGRVAAVIAGLVVIGAGIWIALPRKTADPVVATAPVRVSAETTQVLRNRPGTPDVPGVQKRDAGGLAMGTLPDGLAVTLEKDARIEWLPGGSHHQRRARLTGNAGFRVDADPEHPFIVETGLLRVKVLGTVFQIRQNADSALVILDTGKLQAAIDGDSVVLREGEMAIAYRGQPALTVKVNRDQDTKQVMRMLIAQLTREKLIGDKEHLGWLALDQRQFIIDDVPMPDSTKARYQSKYLLPDGMGLYYGKVKVHGHGYFYEKKELY